MQWLVGDWRGLMPLPWGHVTLTLAAVISGAIIGSEREKREKPAGLRTLILVCLGSAAFTMVSYAFGTTTGDTGRVAAQIVTGIGFLGAGVILHGQSAVSGITTASTIWATAATGIVAGCGYVPAALALSLLVRLVLSGAFWWEQQFIGERQLVRFELIADENHGKTTWKLERLLCDHGVPNGADQRKLDDQGMLRLRLTVRLPRRHRVELLAALACLPEIREIRPLEGPGNGGLS